MPQSFSDWIALGGLVLPLSALAYAAVIHVRTQKRQLQHDEHKRLFEVAEHLGKEGGSIASKLEAAYELKKFRAYRDVIKNICDLPIDGTEGAAQALKTEMETVRKHFQ